MLKGFAWLVVGVVVVTIAVGLLVAKRPHALDARPDGQIPIPDVVRGCDGRDDVKFNEFLARFKSDEKFRESRTIFPLRHSVQGGLPEPMTREEFRKRTWTIVVGDDKAARLRGAEKCDQKINSAPNSAVEVMQHACGDDPLTMSYRFTPSAEARYGSFCYFLTQVGEYKYPFDIR
jgi:hypothetical protein